MAKVYLVTSGKGGTGKTTTAVNLGAALNKFDQDVIIVDGNVMTPNIGLHFGAPTVPVSLSHILEDNAELEEAIYEHESGTKIIPCSLSYDQLGKNTKEKLKQVAQELKDIADHIILDSAAGLGDETKAALGAADEVIIVTNPNTLSVTDSLKTIKLAKKQGKEIKGVIINKVKNSKSEMPLEDIKEMLEIPVLGIIPEDESVEQALTKKNAVIHTHPKSKASQSYQDVAAKILGKKRKPESLFQKALRKIGLR